MPEVQEVFRMATQKVRPDPGALERQFAHQRRMSRNRRNGAIALAAVIGVAATVFAIRLTGGDSGTRPAIQPTLPHADADYTLDLENGTTTLLPRGIAGAFGEATQYALSPDRSTLAYVVPGLGGFGQVFVADLNGSKVRKMTAPGISAEWPAWSPDGTKIAYQESGGALVVLEVATRRSTQVTTEGHGSPLPVDIQPQFTPDGSSLLYTHVYERRPELRIVPVTGGLGTILIDPSGKFPDTQNGSLSPDGSLVTFLSGVWDLEPRRWVADADGTEPRSITGCYGSTPAGTWSPDGSRIVCSDGGGGIIVVDIATGVTTEVAEGFSAIWLDDHTLLIDV
jgi:Tol biopolymer transport system component